MRKGDRQGMGAVGERKRMKENEKKMGEGKREEGELAEDRER